MLRIGFYSPYLDSLSGGERYCLTLASHWSTHHAVELFWNDASIIQRAQKRLNIDISGVKVVQNIFKDRSVFKKLFKTRQYDLIFFLSDGSIPSTLARCNILHFQMPFAKVPYSAVKLSRYQAIVCNSQFTKRSLDTHLNSRATVIYPPVAPIDRGYLQKEKIILSVGRFSGFHTPKKQHVLLEAFAKGIKANRFFDWRLIFIGGLLPSDEKYFESLKSIAKGLPVEFLPNATHGTLTRYYKRASLYWHAAGYGETEPRWMEHFGITTVEAMSAGAIPVAFEAGGQPEIIKEGTDGFLWKTVDDLIEKTSTVMKDKNIALSLQKHAIEKGRQFSVSRFNRAFDELLVKIRL